MFGETKKFLFEEIVGCDSVAILFSFVPIPTSKVGDNYAAHQEPFARSWGEEKERNLE